MKSKSYNKIAFGVILLLQIVCMIYFGNAKQGYFVDELWSYGLANSYYHPHVYSDDALEERWVSGEYFRDYLEVLPEQRFRYGSVVYNQTQDYHPPLFYMVLHTISSLFPNTFSKWYGIIPNIVYFAVSMYLLFALARRIFKSEWLALIPVIAYGFSAGAISNVIYIRMYVLLTVWVLTLFNLHVKWITEDKIQSRDWLILILIAYLGYMSHYYFFVIAFFTAAFYFFYLLWTGKRKTLIKYCVTMFISLLLVALTFPVAYIKLFFGQRGNEAVHNLFNLSDILGNAKRYWSIIGEQLFANSQNILGIVIMVCGLCTIISWLRKRTGNGQTFRMALEKIDETLKREISAVGCVLFVSVSYFVIILKIAPYQVDRYVFGIYPELTLLMFYFVFKIVNYWGSKNTAFATALIMAAVFSIFGVSGKHIQYLYKNYVNNVNIMKEHVGEDCLYITWDYYKLVGNALELENMGRVFTEVPDRIEALAGKLDSDKKNLIVYVDESFDQEEILNRVGNAAGYRAWRPLFESRCKAYELTR